MGEKSKDNKSTDQLKTTIADSRERVGRDLSGLRYELNFPAKLRRSYREGTIFWLAASTAVGAVTVLVLMREKRLYVDLKSGRKVNKELVETGFTLGVLKIGASLLRPAIVQLVKRLLSGVFDPPRARSR